MSLEQGLDTAQKDLEQLAREFREATEAGETTLDEALSIIDTLIRTVEYSNEAIKSLYSEVETQKLFIESLEESLYH
jgi:methyl-accepting chemotaxis protein|tara:strand:+ start:617 stop:847 length:231 start_codon:yes stop_codon:yes gene_type:complete